MSMAIVGHVDLRRQPSGVLKSPYNLFLKIGIISGHPKLGTYRVLHEEVGHPCIVGDSINIGVYSTGHSPLVTLFTESAMRRYTLRSAGAPEKDVNWLEEIETWSQRTKRRIEWDVVKRSDGEWAARMKSKCSES